MLFAVARSVDGVAVGRPQRLIRRGQANIFGSKPGQQALLLDNFAAVSRNYRRGGCHIKRSGLLLFALPQPGKNSYDGLFRQDLNKFLPRAAAFFQVLNQPGFYQGLVWHVAFVRLDLDAIQESFGQT